MTGIYLAKYFENRHINKELKRLIADYKVYTKVSGYDMDFEDYVGIERGMWQCKYGFYRKFKFKK